MLVGSVLGLMIRHGPDNPVYPASASSLVTNASIPRGFFGSGGEMLITTPGSTPALLDAARRAGFPFVPGAVTSSEVLGLLERGYLLQNFFPAEAAGGIAMLKSMAGPIPEVRFMPTGGISESLAAEYLDLPNVAGIGGSWIAPPGLIAAGNFVEIALRAESASRI